jgi:hypothetical protein
MSRWVLEEMQDEAGQMVLVEQGSGVAYRRLPGSTLLWPVGLWKSGRVVSRQQQPGGAPSCVSLLHHASPCNTLAVHHTSCAQLLSGEVLREMLREVLREVLRAVTVSAVVVSLYVRRLVFQLYVVLQTCKQPAQLASAYHVDRLPGVHGSQVAYCLLGWTTC